MQIKARENVLKNLLFIGSPLISLFIINSTVTDPVNTPKLFILGVIATGILVSVLYGISMTEIRERIFPLSLVGLFFLLSIITLYTTSLPITQSIYGVYGRNNGFLAYLFFSFMLVGGLFISTSATHLKLIGGLFIAGLVNILYCGWVIVFGDFLSWTNPYGNILGTFGNPNFIGAFLGMFFSAWVAFLIAPGCSRNFRLVSLIVIPVTAIEIYLSHAIQGRVLMVAGSAVAVFYLIKCKATNRIILPGYSLIVFVAGAFALAGALQIGPLTSLIYKTSVSLRGQYWLSGWNTGVNHPLTGVGYDGLGDWYRRMRDPRALELPGVDTVINTAHNVPLDIFAFGGWPLFLSYLAIIAITLVAIVKYSLKLKTYDRIFTGLVVAWVCYQLQSIISINQIGLGFWGWLLSGAILSYVGIARNEHGAEPSESSGKRNRAKQKTSNPISVGLVAGIGMLVGALISVPPLSSDMKWVSARKTSDALKLEQTLKSGYLNPNNSRKYFMTIELFEQSGIYNLSHKYALEAVKFNPDSYDGWKLLSLLRDTSATEKLEALENMKRLDPLNPNLALSP
jgi:hypothetical protein